MALVGIDEARKIERVLARCAAGGDLARFDREIGQLSESEREVALRELARHCQQANERAAQLAEIEATLEQVGRAAGYLAIVEDVRRDESGAARAYLVLDGQLGRMTAGFLPGLDPAELERGDEVEVVRTGPEQLAVRRRVGPCARRGAVATIEAVEDDGLLRVRRGPETLYLRPAAGLERQIDALGGDAEGAVGRLVSFDEHLGLAFRLFGQGASEELVLREFPSVKRSEIVLPPRVRSALEEEILLPAWHPDLARRYGVESGRCYLFHGEPGIGKTHAARWIASELGRPVYLISGGELADSWYGGTDAKLRARLSAAEREPEGAVVVWDECDAMLVERGRSVVGVEDRLVSMLLTYTDGFAQRPNVVMILITNRVDRIDAALRRALRAVPVAFERPDAPRCRALFELYLRSLPCSDREPAELAREAALAVFAEREPIATLALRDGRRVPVSRSAAVSGALVRAACERARRIGFVREARAGTRGGGVRADDLLLAVDEQFAAAGRVLTRENAGHAVTLPPGVAGEIVAVERGASGERRRHVAAA